jgi:hypothetical protein
LSYANISDHATSQVQLLITNQAVFAMQRATEQSGQVKFVITNNAFALCKEKQHSQKQDFFAIVV